MSKNSLIRKIYLYLFAIIGLTLLVIGSVRFIDMGLKMFVFTKAEQDEQIRQQYKPYINQPLSRVELEKIQNSEELSEKEIEAVQQWYKNYQNWQEEQGKIDYLASRRQEDASLNLALILVGLPLYLYHWRTIKRETDNN